MKPHTYSFRAKNFSTKEVINATIDATGKTQAQNAAMMDTRFKGWEIILSSFRRTDTAKGANRAGGLDANGKQLDARTAYEKAKEATCKEFKDKFEAAAYKDFLNHLDLAIEALYNCRMENNAEVLSLDIKSLYASMKEHNPFK
jgi:hypothetical protein